MKRETICALCTSPGRGALSVIRISGPKALEITKKQAPFLPSKLESHRAYVGVLKKNQKELDQVVLTYFEEGKSFTGEETLEISCHGGRVYSEILKELLKDGARLAEKGEFSLQSFSNGKMDLIQAEGLYQLIESQNQQAHQASFKQLQGALSKKLEEIEKKWLETLSYIEADIDFSLEGLSLLNKKELQTSLKELEIFIQELIKKYQPFERVQRGLTCALFGRVNTGKSTLFNALLGEEKAIVSKEEGTTKDPVESQLKNANGLSIHMKDTAGFRATKSEGEQKGQAKSKELLSISDIQALVFDPLQLDKYKEEEIFHAKAPYKILIFTKKDLCPKEWQAQNLYQKILQKFELDIPKENVFFVSALQNDGIKELRKKLLSFGEIKEEDFLITNYRHYKGLKTMEGTLKRAWQILTEQEGERDLLALELREGLVALYKILGKQIEDRVLDQIFQQFCIGK